MTSAADRAPIGSHAREGARASRPRGSDPAALIPATKRWSGFVLNASIGRTVDFCIRHARAVILLAVILGVGAAGYAAQHFTINTDISKLISSDLPWRQRQLALQQAFP